MNPNYYDLAESPEDSNKKMHNMKTLARYMEQQNMEKQQQTRERREQPSSSGFE